MLTAYGRLWSTLKLPLRGGRHTQPAAGLHARCCIRPNARSILGMGVARLFTSTKFIHDGHVFAGALCRADSFLFSGRTPEVLLGADWEPLSANLATTGYCGIAMHQETQTAPVFVGRRTRRFLRCFLHPPFEVMCYAYNFWTPRLFVKLFRITSVEYKVYVSALCNARLPPLKIFLTYR